MSFAQLLDNLPLQKSRLLHRFEDLILPKSDMNLESLARESRALTLQNFGRTMRLFAPLYLYLVAGQPKTESGGVIDAQAWLRKAEP